VDDGGRRYYHFDMREGEFLRIYYRETGEPESSAAKVSPSKSITSRLSTGRVSFWMNARGKRGRGKGGDGRGFQLRPEASKAGRN